MSNIAIIIVSWNTGDLLRRCIETVQASLAGAGIAYTIVVVDNASSDGTPAMLRAEHPEVLLWESGRNLGFAGGNNLALRRLEIRGWRLEQSVQPPTSNLQSLPVDYILLLNPDTEVVGDAIPRLLRYLDEHPGVAVVGPRLRYPDGSVQPSRRRFPRRGTFFWESTPLEQLWPGNPWARRYRCADTPDDVEQEVDWLVGAALLVRRGAIERAGLLDAGFTMYSEELEWQRRIRGLSLVARHTDAGGWACEGGQKAHRHTPIQGGLEGRSLSEPPRQNPCGEPQALRVVYLPDATIIHHEGKSSEQALAQRYLNFQRSRLRAARLFYGERFAAALRLFLRAAYAAELAVESGKWLIGHKRALRARRVAVYWQVVRGLEKFDNVY